MKNRKNEKKRWNALREKIEKEKQKRANENRKHETEWKSHLSKRSCTTYLGKVSREKRKIGREKGREEER